VAIKTDSNYPFYRKYAFQAGYNAARITASCWVYTDYAVAFSPMVMKGLGALGDGAQAGAWSIGIGSTGTFAMKMRFTAGAGVDTKKAQSAAFTDNTWYNLVGTYDGSNVLLYVNGTLITGDALTGDIPDNSDDLRILGNKNAANNYWGTVAEACVWNETLTQAEATTLAGGACPITVRSGSVILYDPLFSGSNNVLLDNKTDLNIQSEPHPRIFGRGA
jgi:hypothetical protein